MNYCELIDDIQRKLDEPKHPSFASISPCKYVLFTRRSELLNNKFGRPDTIFKYCDTSRDGEVRFGLIPFDKLFSTKKYTEEDNLMEMYWDGCFGDEEDEGGE